MEHGVTADWLGSAYRETVQLFMQRDTLTKKAWKLNLVENGAGIVMKSGNNVCLIRGVKGEKKGRRKRVGILKIDDVQTFNTLNPRVDEQTKI